MIVGQIHTLSGLPLALAKAKAFVTENSSKVSAWAGAANIVTAISSTANQPKTSFPRRRESSFVLATAIGQEAPSA